MSIDIFFGRDIGNIAERRCLRRLLCHLTAVQTDAVVLANFVVGPQRRQVDMVVATPKTAVVVEIKGYTHPVHGDLNGPWHLDLGDGKTRSLGPTNPYHQALDCRYAVCDALSAHADLQGHIARAMVLGSLCVFPSPLATSALPASDHKVVIGGAPELEALLERPLPTAMALDTWRSFARSLQLSHGGEAEPRPASTLVESYLARFLELRRALAVPYIEPLIAGEQVATSHLVGRLVDGVQLHIVGPSG
ncbi:MAG TPA: nuclease-related domain-containing protein [Burkholderiales bacterium]|nr:nuclease-related domain-containing protein [Burkholderiales bacterium]